LGWYRFAKTNLASTALHYLDRWTSQIWFRKICWKI